MGYAHILWLYQDGIKDDDRPDELRQEVGDAVLKVCLRPDYEHTPMGRVRVTRHPVRCHTNCINHVAALHNSEDEILVWSGNRLVRLAEIDDDELEKVRALFEARFYQRKLNGRSNPWD